MSSRARCSLNSRPKRRISRLGAHGADTVLLAGDPPHRPEPKDQRQAAVLKKPSRRSPSSGVRPVQHNVHTPLAWLYLLDCSRRKPFSSESLLCVLTAAAAATIPCSSRLADQTHLRAYRHHCLKRPSIQMQSITTLRPPGNIFITPCDRNDHERLIFRLDKSTV